MANCGCGNTCNCVVSAGTGVTITGTGTPANPYVITASAAPGAISYRDTNTVDMTFTGAGTGASPFEVSADVKINPDGGLTSSTAGVAVKLDPRAGNTLALTADGLRSEGAAAVTLDPAGGLVYKPGIGIAVKPNPASPAPVTVDASGVKVTNDLTALIARDDFLQAMARQQTYLNGGGDKGANATHIDFPQSFTAAAPRRSTDQTPTAFTITKPANGAVITGIGGQANVTIPTSGNYAGMIPLPDWSSLWYLLPTTAASGATVPGAFRIANYTASTSMPDNAVMIASRSGLSDKSVRWGDGSKTVPWLLNPTPIKEINGTTNLGSAGQQALWYRIVDNFLEIDFFVVWGSNASSPGGTLYWDIPVTIPVHNLNRQSHNQVGWGKFWSSDSGAKPAMDWPMMPWISNGSNRMYFLTPTAGNDARLNRMRFHDGNFNTSSSIPLLTEGFHNTQSSELQGAMRIPINRVYAP